MTTRIEAFKQPEYTGENRCTPCTVVNLGIAVILAAGFGILSPPVGLAVFALSLGAIYFRGYLVPGTPTLTKRYLPERVLRWFDKAPVREATDEFVPEADAESPGSVDADVAGETAHATRLEPDVSTGHGRAPGAFDASGGVTSDETGSTTNPDDAGDAAASAVDSTEGASEPELSPERLLADLDVVEPCESVDDLCLTERFERDWRVSIDERRDDLTDPETLAHLFDADPETLEIRNSDDRPLVQAMGVGRQRWMSSGALLADAAANAVLVDEHERWAALEPHQRLPMLKALRSFLPDCPLCGGEIEMGNETVESCCREWDVIAVSCHDCEERYLEVDTNRIDGAVE